MDTPMRASRVTTLFFLIILLFQTGCTGGSTAPSNPTASGDISVIAISASTSKNIAAAQGGTVAQGEFTAIFPANALPADAQLKAAQVAVSNSRQDPSLIDVSNAYILSTTSSSSPIELVSSANRSICRSALLQPQGNQHPQK